MKRILIGNIFPKRVMNYANVWERFAAMVIDVVLVALISLAVSAVISLPYHFVFIAWLYEAFQTSGSAQATIGQKIMRIKLSNKQGGKLDFASASLRHFSKYLSLFTALSGYLIIFLDKDRQCLHDKISESIVVTSESFQTVAFQREDVE